MGTVFRATQLQLDRAVAVKLLHEGALSDPASVARFEREALAVARLRHPHIVAVHDFGVEPGVGAYLVMECLEGSSLRHELGERGRFAPEEAVRLIRQALAAAREAHAAGVVHRDLKPENIVLERTPRGARVKVLDFGIAKLERPADSQSTMLTRSGQVLGTPLYMSPEQHRGEPSDARSDLYALGCVLYEMLTGRTPFVARSVVELVFKHLEAPEPPSRTAPDVPASLDRIVLRALATNPVDRFETAEAFDGALQGWRDGSIGPSERPPARTPNNLPREATPFVGRLEQLAEVRRALETARLVTLTGPGGAGKTRLALEAARELLAELADGVWVVDLAPIVDPDLVLPAIARTLGVAEDAAPAAEIVARAIGDRRVLVVLDTFEHVLAAAPLVAELLAAAPRLTLLVTSRARLRLRAEHELSVPPLDVPAVESVPLDALARCEAVALFVERARAVDPRFELTAENAEMVAEICRWLEGLPLAIELAVARLTLIAPEAMLARLEGRLKLLTGGARDLPERHQTMRGAIAWSYELLEPEEQVLFHRLSVFVGGFSLEAAEAVCGAAGGLELDVLDAASSLLDRSLLRKQGEGRLGMLETIREYAAERLRASGEAEELERRHAAYVLALGEAAGEALEGE